MPYSTSHDHGVGRGASTMSNQTFDDAEGHRPGRRSSRGNQNLTRLDFR